MTEQECDQLINSRLREYFENRKRLGCLRHQIKMIGEKIELALKDPLDKGLNSYLQSNDDPLARRIADMRALVKEQETIREFLAGQGINDLPRD